MVLGWQSKGEIFEKINSGNPQIGVYGVADPGLRLLADDAHELLVGLEPLVRRRLVLPKNLRDLLVVGGVVGGALALHLLLRLRRPSRRRALAGRWCW